MDAHSQTHLGTGSKLISSNALIGKVLGTQRPVSVVRLGLGLEWPCEHAHSRFPPSWLGCMLGRTLSFPLSAPLISPSCPLSVPPISPSCLLSVPLISPSCPLSVPLISPSCPLSVPLISRKLDSKNLAPKSSYFTAKTLRRVAQPVFGK